MQYKAVIFDFDYTLGDSTEGIIESANDALKKMGYEPAEREAIRKTIGLSLPETYQVLTGDKDLEKGETFRQYFVKKADEIMTKNSELYPDARKILEYLKQNGVRVAVVTTKFDYRIQGILEKCEATEYVSEIVGANNVSNPKPDPEGTLNVLKEWELAKNEVLYVGDSLVDAKTAQNAGISFAAVTTGTTSEEDFAPYEKVGVFANLTELMNVL